METAKDILEKRVKNLSPLIINLAFLWIMQHAQHPPECAKPRGGSCTCELDMIKTTYRESVREEG